MNFNFHTNHTLLLVTISLSFLFLSTIVAIIPAYTVQENNPPLAQALKMNDSELRGMRTYISEGCLGCHTQQVRSNAIDQQWGERPSIPADFANNTRMDFWRNTASLLGSERTGPDLTNVGLRQPGEIWHLLHLYNPRAVVKESIMPAYPWLFQEVSEVRKGQRAINLPSEYSPANGKKVITTERVNDLVAYLVSLKQPPVPDYVDTEFNSYKWQKVEKKDPKKQEVLKLDGAKLYAGNCKVCHQDKGQGIKGAFPSLAGSEYANNEDPSDIITTVLFGLDRENEYGAMLAFNNTLSDEEIAAILTFERSNWGNKGAEVKEEEVKAIREKGKPEDWPL